jgi:hypothetical protein
LNLEIEPPTPAIEPLNTPAFTPPTPAMAAFSVPTPSTPAKPRPAAEAIQDEFLDIIQEELEEDLNSMESSDEFEISSDDREDILSDDWFSVDEAEKSEPKDSPSDFWSFIQSSSRKQNKIVSRAKLGGNSRSQMYKKSATGREDARKNKNIRDLFVHAVC